MNKALELKKVKVTDNKANDWRCTSELIVTIDTDEDTASRFVDYMNEQDTEWEACMECFDEDGLELNSREYHSRNERYNILKEIKDMWLAFLA